ncbi:MAG: phosphoenolpyruvate--protein phosphotransferase [Myxococcota bacterium]|nr:phosphoenolpyruvate--protein phosphotransferase [Myxococcota bacterium]
MINSGRRMLNGFPVGHGWVQGIVRCLAGHNAAVPHRHLNVDRLDYELQCFDGAVQAVASRIRSVIEQLRSSDAFMADGGDVLAAHVSIIEDPELRSRVERVIREAHINAGWALDRVLEDVELEFGSLNDPYIAARMLDIRQVFHRLQRELVGGQLIETGVPEIGPGEVLVAHDLEPVIAMQILQQKPAAIITEEGTATSHLALLCRALRVPAMVGVAGASEGLLAGDKVLIDLEEGLVVRDPDRRDLALAQVHRDEGELSLVDPELPALSLDGERVHLHANLDVVGSMNDALSEGAEGIGLFRSEYLFLSGEFQSVDAQARVYGDLLEHCPGPVVVRTFDVGSDKLPLGSSWEPNPALGLRALRSYQVDPSSFRNQLRALMQVASDDARLHIMLPMVDGVESWLWAAEEIDLIAASAGKQRGRDFLLGAMVELPSLVFVIESLVEKVDFLSLGTNDLLQYLLAVDRQNPVLAKYSPITHPALLKVIDRVVAAARAADIPLSCCGEMASRPLGVMILVGLGLRSLSLPPSELALIRTFLRRSELSVFEGLAQKALTLSHAGAIEEMLTGHYQDWKAAQRR